MGVNTIYINNMVEKCLNCGNDILLDESKMSPYYISALKRKKYCSRKCQNIAYNLPINYHELAIENVNKLLPLGTLNTLNDGTRNKGGYTPDLFNDEFNYELELCLKRNHIIEKIKRRDLSNNIKKNALIIYIHPLIKKKFDEFYFYDDNKLIKLE